MAARLILVAAALVASVGLAGCFSPQTPGCAFSCAVDHLCPAGYFCAQDGFCHRTDGKGACTLSSFDAAPPPDGAAD
jgi:hypothetical protein